MTPIGKKVNLVLENQGNLTKVGTLLEMNDWGVVIKMANAIQFYPWRRIDRMWWPDTTVLPRSIP